MNGYLIYLPDFSDSVALANNAKYSAQKFNWPLQLYKGVNGKKYGLIHENIGIFQGNKKCIRYMSRPGTQGCFLSQYKLWRLCLETNQPIIIYEHDVVFKKKFDISFANEDFDVYKFEGSVPAKPMEVGTWYEGARAYCIKPKGAEKLVNFVAKNGAMPADWMLNTGIVKISFDKTNKVSHNNDRFSFTENL